MHFPIPSSVLLLGSCNLEFPKDRTGGPIKNVIGKQKPNHQTPLWTALRYPPNPLKWDFSGYFCNGDPPLWCPARPYIPDQGNPVSAADPIQMPGICLPFSYTSSSPHPNADPRKKVVHHWSEHSTLSLLLTGATFSQHHIPSSKLQIDSKRSSRLGQIWHASHLFKFMLDLYPAGPRSKPSLNSSRIRHDTKNKSGPLLPKGVTGRKAEEAWLGPQRDADPQSSLYRDTQSD